MCSWVIASQATCRNCNVCVGAINFENLFLSYSIHVLFEERSEYREGISMICIRFQIVQIDLTSCIIKIYVLAFTKKESRFGSKTWIALPRITRCDRVPFNITFIQFFPNSKPIVADYALEHGSHKVRTVSLHDLFVAASTCRLSI